MILGGRVEATANQTPCFDSEQLWLQGRWLLFLCSLSKTMTVYGINEWLMMETCWHQRGRRQRERERDASQSRLSGTFAPVTHRDFRVEPGEMWRKQSLVSSWTFRRSSRSTRVHAHTCPQYMYTVIPSTAVNDPNWTLSRDTYSLTHWLTASLTRWLAPVFTGYHSSDSGWSTSHLQTGMCLPDGSSLYCDSPRTSCEPFTGRLGPDTKPSET